VNHILIRTACSWMVFVGKGDGAGIKIRFNQLDDTRPVSEVDLCVRDVFGVEIKGDKGKSLANNHFVMDCELQAWLSVKKPVDSALQFYGVSAVVYAMPKRKMSAKRTWDPEPLSPQKKKRLEELRKNGACKAPEVIDICDDDDTEDEAKVQVRSDATDTQPYVMEECPF